MVTEVDCHPTRSQRRSPQIPNRPRNNPEPIYQTVNGSYLGDVAHADPNIDPSPAHPLPVRESWRGLRGDGRVSRFGARIF